MRGATSLLSLGGGSLVPLTDSNKKSRITMSSTKNNYMNEAEFDQFADEYRQLHTLNIQASGEKPEYFAEYKILDLARRLKRLGREPSSILDFGAGVGNSIPYFKQEFPSAKLTCADVSQKSLDIAASRFADSANYHKIEKAGLSSLDSSFDVVFSACVFHHIPHEEHIKWLASLHKVTKKSGLIAIFEHNPFNTVTVNAVNTCAFDANARLINVGKFKENLSKSGWSKIRHEYRIFFPKSFSVLRRFEPKLTWLPLGAQYVVYAEA